MFREANKYVDVLPKEGCTLQEDFVVFDVSPYVAISSLISSDVCGVSYCRLLAATMAILTS